MAEVGARRGEGRGKLFVAVGEFGECGVCGARGGFVAGWRGEAWAVVVRVDV